MHTLRKLLAYVQLQCQQALKDGVACHLCTSFYAELLTLRNSERGRRRGTGREEGKDRKEWDKPWVLKRERERNKHNAVTGQRRQATRDNYLSVKGSNLFLRRNWLSYLQNVLNSKDQVNLLLLRITNFRNVSLYTPTMLCFSSWILTWTQSINDKEPHALKVNTFSVGNLMSDRNHLSYSNLCEPSFQTRINGKKQIRM